MRERHPTGGAGDYIRAMFPDSDDHVAILAVPRGKGGRVEQRFPTSKRAAAAQYQAWLRHLNATGYDVYLGVNPVDPTRRKREKQDVRAVCRLQLDLDDDGPASMRRLQEDVGRGILPPPAHVLSSSKDRFQVLWNTDSSRWKPDQAEDVMSRLAAKYGGDQAATDISRVMRVPGFRNKKPGRDDAVCTWNHHEGRQVRPRDFRDLPERPDPAVRTNHKKGEKRKPGQALSQSEHDWAWTRTRLRKGHDPAVIEADLRSRRPDKPNPVYYARRTVQRAMDSLNLEGDP